MSDMYNTDIPALLVAAIERADATEARRMFDDADYCARKLLAGLMSTGRLLSGISDNLDTAPDELRTLGESIAVTAELVAGFGNVVETYNRRIRDGEITGGAHHA